MRSRAIYGCAGPVLSADERSFFREAGPGDLSSSPATSNPDQVRALVAELRDCVADGTAPILIDQEGGPGGAPEAAAYGERPAAAARFGAALCAGPGMGPGSHLSQCPPDRA